MILFGGVIIGQQYNDFYGYSIPRTLYLFVRQ